MDPPPRKKARGPAASPSSGGGAPPPPSLDVDKWMQCIETKTSNLNMTHVEGIPTVRAMLAWMKARGEVWSQLRSFKMPRIKMGLRTVEQLERFAPVLTRLDLSGVLKHCDEVLPFSSTRLEHLVFPRGSRMTDAGLCTTLNACPALRSLELCECNGITNMSLEHALVACRRLERIKLERCTWVTGRTLYFLSGANYNSLHTIANQMGTKNQALRQMAQSASKGGSGGSAAAMTVQQASKDVFRDDSTRAIIRHIELDKCEALCSASLLHLKHFPPSQLLSFSLKGCVAIDASCAAHLARAAASLELLDLTWTQVDDASVRIIARSCPRLRYLSLAHCDKITGDALWWLSPPHVAQRVDAARAHEAKLELEQLSLRACVGLTQAAAVPLLCMWKALRWLDLGGLESIEGDLLERSGWRTRKYQQFARRAKEEEEDEGDGGSDGPPQDEEDIVRKARAAYALPRIPSDVHERRGGSSTLEAQDMGELLEMFGE